MLVLSTDTQRLHVGKGGLVFTYRHAYGISQVQPELHQRIQAATFRPRPFGTFQSLVQSCAFALLTIVNLHFSAANHNLFCQLLVSLTESVVGLFHLFNPVTTFYQQFQRIGYQPFLSQLIGKFFVFFEVRPHIRRRHGVFV